MNIRDEVTKAVEEQRRQSEEQAREARERRVAERREELRVAVGRILGRGPEDFEEVLDAGAFPDAAPTPMAKIDGYLFQGSFDKTAKQYEVRLVWPCPCGHFVWLPRNRYGGTEGLKAYGATSLEALDEHFEQYDHYAAHPDECPHCKDAQKPLED